MEELIIDMVAKVSNGIYKQKGYLITIPREAVETVIHAEELIMEKLEEWDNKQTKQES